MLYPPGISTFMTPAAHEEQSFRCYHFFSICNQIVLKTFDDILRSNFLTSLIYLNVEFRSSVSVLADEILTDVI